MSLTFIRISPNLVDSFTEISHALSQNTPNLISAGDPPHIKVGELAALT